MKYKALALAAAAGLGWLNGGNEIEKFNSDWAKGQQIVIRRVWICNKL